MNGIEKRLTRLEAASVRTAQMPVTIITLVPAERASPVTATAGLRVRHREPGELEETFA